MSATQPLFSIVVPVYQNRANLATTTTQLLGLAAQLPDFSLELVYVDDGSTDGSRAMLDELALKYAGQVRVVFLTRNFGQNAAIQAGLRHAHGDAIGVISCDLQEPCEKFVEMLSLWRQGHKFVIGERVERREGWWHRQISSIYWRLLRRYAFSHYPELGYDFCLIDRQLANDINRINEKNASIFVLIFWLGYQPARVPIVREMRRDGSSQWKLGRKLVFTVDTMIGFTTFPARLLTLMGFGIASLAGLYFLHVLARYLILQSAPPGWMTLVALITLLGSLNLFAAGILSEYLLRILDESRKRPPFVVERTAGRESAFPS